MHRHQFAQQPSGLSEQGLAAAVEFLAPYYSLYSLGYREANGTYRSETTGEPLDERPLVLHCVGGYYDRFGNIFENAPFIRDWSIALRFYLYEIDDSGFADIVIEWRVPESCFVRLEMFRFIGGEYVSMGYFEGCPIIYLFSDGDGRLIALYDDMPCSYHVYSYVTFADGVLYEQLIIEREPDCHEWEEYHQSAEFFASPVMFGTNTPLTPIPPLTDLENEIIALLRENSHERPHVEGDVLTVSQAELLLRTFGENSEITQLPHMDRIENGVRYLCFSVNYFGLLDRTHAPANAPVPRYTHFYVWVNPATGEFVDFMEAGTRPYANIPDILFPVPARDGAIIPYDEFSPIMDSDGSLGMAYIFLDTTVFEAYQTRLRNAGFTDHGAQGNVGSYWTYERGLDGAMLAAAVFISDGKVYMNMYVNYFPSVRTQNN
jgi:hypothetical protein